MNLHQVFQVRLFFTWVPRVKIVEIIVEFKRIAGYLFSQFETDKNHGNYKICSGGCQELAEKSQRCKYLSQEERKKIKEGKSKGIRFEKKTA